MLLKVLYAQHLTAGNKVMIMVRDIEQNLMNALCDSTLGLTAANMVMVMSQDAELAKYDLDYRYVI